jgi:hypothetical protein
MSKYVDLLDEDKPIAEQKFVCLSFISPEYLLKRKELFYFENFVKQYDFNKNMELMTQFINFMAYKYNVDSTKVFEDFKGFVEEERQKLESGVEDDFKNFMDKNEDKLQEEFSRKNSFQTNTRGIKVRGVFPTQEEAEMRCKMLREVDPNHDVYVGPVGIWVPFHPEAYKTGNVQYLEKELNELMHEKKKNEDKAATAFETRVKESKLQAIEENMKNAQEHGNKLTQTINEKGELVSIENMNTTEKNLGVNATMNEIRSELFEGDDVVMDKNTDHGMGELMKKLNQTTAGEAAEDGNKNETE